jgi:transcriptional regulator with XRE-family HTH domain
LQFVPIKLKSLKPKETDFEPQTLGEHVRKRRLVLRLTQKQVAAQLGVVPWTILNWEKGHTQPPIASLPAVARFLDYDPFREPKTLPEHLLAKRRVMGWSIEEAAEVTGVDPGSWSKWERGQMILYHRHRILVARLLDLPSDELDQEMVSRWNRSHECGH